MVTRRQDVPHTDGVRHSAQWYGDRLGDDNTIQPGDRMLIPCQGGPSTSRLETFPPQLEVEERDGMYELEDDGPPEQWRYLFVPDSL